jgi:hypothetical protein
MLASLALGKKMPNYGRQEKPRDQRERYIMAIFQPLAEKPTKKTLAYFSLPTLYEMGLESRSMGGSHASTRESDTIPELRMGLSGAIRHRRAL